MIEKQIELGRVFQHSFVLVVLPLQYHLPLRELTIDLGARLRMHVFKGIASIAAHQLAPVLAGLFLSVGAGDRQRSHYHAQAAQTCLWSSDQTHRKTFVSAAPWPLISP